MIQENCIVFHIEALGWCRTQDAQGFVAVFRLDDDYRRLRAVPAVIQVLAAVVHVRPVCMMDAEFQLAHEVAGGDGPVQVVDQAGHERAVHDDGRAVWDVQGPNILADRVGRLVIVNLALYLMGAEAEAVGHDAEDDQDGEEIPFAVPDPGCRYGADEERGDEQATVGQKVGDRQEVRVHEIGDTRCCKEQAEDSIDGETVAEPAAFLTAPFERSG